MSSPPIAPAAAADPGRESAPILDPIDVADYLLELLLRQSASSVWLDPQEPGAHQICIEHRRGALGSFRLLDGLGDAVLARLALLAGLDLLAIESQAGTARIRQGAEVAEVVVAVRRAARGLAGEVRLFEERATPVAQSALADHPEVFQAGTRIGAYRIERLLGRGGMGVVYEVEHTALGKRFAMKVLFGSMLVRDPASARRFVREARAAARIRNPGIVDVTDFGTLGDGRPYLVMALIDGQTLHQLAVREGPLDPGRAVRLVRLVAEALRAAHDCGVVHRDLTPANVFVRRAGADESVVLVDFGSAHMTDGDAEVPDGPPGTVIGTPHYMSPEQIRGRATDNRSDLYALGVILHELIHGRPPFDGATARDIAMQHLRAPIPDLARAGQELPPELVELAARLLAKAPEDRPDGAAAVVAALERIEILLSRRGWRRWLPG